MVVVVIVVVVVVMVVVVTGSGSSSSSSNGPIITLHCTMLLTCWEHDRFTCVYCVQLASDTRIHSSKPSLMPYASRVFTSICCKLPHYDELSTVDISCRVCSGELF